jgi:hypothetical protein
MDTEKATGRGEVWESITTWMGGLSFKFAVPFWCGLNPCPCPQVMQLMLKSCDISNEARPLKFTEGWVKCLLEEFFQQVCSVAR